MTPVAGETNREVAPATVTGVSSFGLLEESGVCCQLGLWLSGMVLSCFHIVLSLIGALEQFSRAVETWILYESVQLISTNSSGKSNQQACLFVCLWQYQVWSPMAA